MGVHGADGPEGIVGLGVDEVDARSGERVADVVVEGVRVEVAVDAGYGYQYRVGTSVGSEQHTVKQYASLCFYLQFFHIGCKITMIPRSCQTTEY